MSDKLDLEGTLLQWSQNVGRGPSESDVAELAKAVAVERASIRLVAAIEYLATKLTKEYIKETK